MATPSKSKRPITLCIDIGGTGLKALTVDADGKATSERQRVETPKPATPKAVLAALDPVIRALPAFDRVSIGFPGVVVDGVVQTAPNLDPSWADVPLADKVPIEGVPVGPRSIRWIPTMPHTLIWAEAPDLWDGAGILILVASGLYIWHRETQLGLKR